MFMLNLQIIFGISVNKPELILVQAHQHKLWHSKYNNSDVAGGIYTYLVYYQYFYSSQEKQTII